MPIYRYTANDSQQHPVDGHLEAASVEAARQHLEAQGLQVVEVLEVEPAPPTAPPGPLGPEEAQRFLEDLAELSAAGVSLPAGLRAAAEEGGNPRLTAALLHVADQLERGRSVEEVVSSSELALPDYARHLIGAAARTGQLGPTLLELLDQAQEIAALRRRLWQSFAYPLLIVVLAAAVFAAFLWFVGGGFEKIYGDFGARLPASTVAALALRRAIPWLVPTLALGVVLLVALWRLGISPQRRQGWLATLPVLGPISHWLGLLEWLGLLRALVQNQVSLFEALRLAGDGVSNAHVAQLSRVLAEGVARGRSLSQAMTTQRAMPSSLVPLVRWGEEIGALSESLEISSELLEERVRLRTLWLRMALPPIVFIAVGGGLLWMVALFMLPLISLISTLTGGH